MKWSREATTAVADAPLGHDSLNITPYVDGVSGFIKACQTPMTIAVQGDWGTGKTNMMMLVERALAPHGHFRLSDPPQAEPTRCSPISPSAPQTSAESSFGQ